MNQYDFYTSLLVFDDVIRFQMRAISLRTCKSDDIRVYNYIVIDMSTYTEKIIADSKKWTIKSYCSEEKTFVEFQSFRFVLIICRVEFLPVTKVFNNGLPLLI